MVLVGDLCFVIEGLCRVYALNSEAAVAMTAEAAAEMEIITVVAGGEIGSWGERREMVREN